MGDENAGGAGTANQHPRLFSENLSSKVATLFLALMLVSSSFGSHIPISSAKPAEVKLPFTRNVRLSGDLVAVPYWDNPDYMFRAMEPSIAVDFKTGNIYVAFMGLVSGEFHICVVRSTDGGSSFSTPLCFPDRGFDPSVAVDSQGNVYVAYASWAYQPGRVIVAKSSDQGRTFSQFATVNEDVGRNYLPDRPWIHIDESDTVYVTWQDDRNNGMNLFFAKSTDGGRTFSKNKMLYAQSAFAPMASDGRGNLYVAACYIGVLKSSDRGETFERLPLRIPDRCSIAADGLGNVYVAWTAQTGAYVPRGQVWLSRSNDEGRSWSQPLQINEAGPARYTPWLAARNGTVHIAWMDDRSGSVRVYYAYSVDGGRTFSPNIEVSDEDGGDPKQLWIGLDFMSMDLDQRGVPVIVWGDARDKVHDVFFAKRTFTLGGLPPDYILFADPLVRIIPGYTASLSIDVVGKAPSERQEVWVWLERVPLDRNIQVNLSSYFLVTPGRVELLINTSIVSGLGEHTVLVKASNGFVVRSKMITVNISSPRELEIYRFPLRIEGVGILTLEILSSAYIWSVSHNATLGYLSFSVYNPSPLQTTIEVHAPKVAISGEPDTFIDGLEYSSRLKQNSTHYIIAFNVTSGLHSVIIGTGWLGPKISELEALINVLRQENAELRAQVANLTAQLNSLTAKIHAAQETISDLSNKLRKATEEVAKLEGLLDSAREVIASLENELASVKKQSSTLSQQLDKAKNEIMQLQQDLEGTKASLRVAESLLSDARYQLTVCNNLYIPFAAAIPSTLAAFFALLFLRRTSLKSKRR